MANIDIGGRLHSTATGNVVTGANEVLDDSKGKKQSVINAEVDAALEGKQDEIADLATIRSGAAAGATAYQKPGTGIPAPDMASGVQTSLGKADSAYQKPSGGIPKTDLDSGVQGSLELADSAVQADPIGSIVPPVDPSEFATKEEVEGLEAKVTDIAKCGDDDSNDSLNVGDEDGNVILSLQGGNIKTKNFDSSNIGAKLRIGVGDDETTDELNIGDEAGNVILSLSGGNLKTKNFDSRSADSPLMNLNIVMIGDSITWMGGDNCDDEDGWTYWFKQKANPKSCRSYAVSGATLCYQPSWQTQNDAYMQLQRIISDKGEGMYPNGIDLVFVAMGTNDLGNSSAKYSVTAEEEFNNATTYANYTQQDLTSFAKAIRYLCEQLYVNFPNVQIVFLSPQQRSNFNTSMLLTMGDFIESCTDYLSVNTIRLDKHCGTYHTRECVENHKLIDGTHTSQLGARENGYFIYNRVKSLLKF